MSLQVHCGHHGPSNGPRFNIVVLLVFVLTFRFVANDPHWSSFSARDRRLQIFRCLVVLVVMLDAVHEAASLHLLDCKIVVLDLM